MENQEFVGSSPPHNIPEDEETLIQEIKGIFRNVHSHVIAYRAKRRYLSLLVNSKSIVGANYAKRK